jgi:hypothetical protein
MHRIECPSCGHRLKYQDEHAGKRARCQKCGTSLRLPVPAGQTAVGRATPGTPLPAPPGSVTFKCPRCHKPVRTASLGKLSNLASGPPPEIGLLNLITGQIPKRPDEAGLAPLTCPHCRQNFPCADVLDLKGEVLFNYPNCDHQMLTKAIAAADIIVCEVCGRGFTGGAIRNLKGEIRPAQDAHAGPGEGPPDPGGQRIEVCYVCKQDTHIHQFKGGGTSDTNTVLSYEQRTWVVQPETGSRSCSRTCPVCGGNLTFKVASYQLARDRAKMWATVGIVGFPPFLVLLLYGILTQGPGGKMSGVGMVGLFGSLIWLLPAVASIPYLVPGWRAKLITVASCVSMTGDSRSAHLWRQGEWNTKSAGLSIGHTLKMDKAGSGADAAARASAVRG